MNPFIIWRFPFKSRCVNTCWSAKHESVCVVVCSAFTYEHFAFQHDLIRPTENERVNFVGASSFQSRSQGFNTWIRPATTCSFVLISPAKNECSFALWRFQTSQLKTPLVDTLLCATNDRIHCSAGSNNTCWSDPLQINAFASKRLQLFHSWKQGDATGFDQTR